MKLSSTSALALGLISAVIPAFYLATHKKGNNDLPDLRDALNDPASPNKVLCDLGPAPSLSENVLSSRRKDTSMLQLYNDLARMQTISDLTLVIEAAPGSRTEDFGEELTGIRLSPDPDVRARQIAKIRSWIAQLGGDPGSALARVTASMNDLQKETRRVIEQNQKRARLTIPQEELEKSLHSNGFQFIAVSKADYPAFVQSVITKVKTSGSGAESELLQQELLSKPESLSKIVPDVKLATCGDTYLFYQGGVSLPAGLATANNVTLGNIANTSGNNVSVTGYQFSAPNAPYGDKGVEVQLESLLGALTQEQRTLFLKDPRTFLEEYYLDFTSQNPDLDRNFTIQAQGDNRNYQRSNLGPKIDEGKLLEDAKQLQQ